MGNLIRSALERVYVQLETSFGVIPNTTGTATVANANAMRLISFAAKPTRPFIDRPDKTGTFSNTIGQGGRYGATWTLKASAAANGAPGVPPDCDELLVATFGKAGVVAASTSVTYALEDAAPSLSIYSFRTAENSGTPIQRCLYGAVVDSMEVVWGQDNAEVTWSGTAVWMIDTAQFATAPTALKGGLTTFPAEPSAPVTNGAQALGIVGQITLDGNVYTLARSGKVTYKMNRGIRNNIFNQFTGSRPTQGKRNIGMEISLFEDDSANLKALYNKAILKTGVPIITQIGVDPGNIWSFNMGLIQLETPDFDDTSETDYTMNFGYSLAHASSLTAKDESTLVIT